MQNLTPNAIELVDYYNDGEEARHFSFKLLEPHSMAIPLPGQFFMLYIPGIGSAPFTFTSVPDVQGIFSSLIRRMGRVTSALFDCKPGSILGARGPFGKGWALEELAGQRVLIIAGGCGLAPLVSLTDYLIKEQSCEQVTLIYGSRSAAAQLLNPERQRWQKHIAVYDVVEDKDFPGLTGTPLDALPTVLKDLQKTPTVLLLCGPEVMMHAVAKHFVNLGLSPQSIWLSIERRMHCAVGTCGHCYLEHHYACKDGPTYRWDTIQPFLIH